MIWKRDRDRCVTVAWPNFHSVIECRMSVNPTSITSVNFTGRKLEKLENDFRVREVQKNSKIKKCWNSKIWWTSWNFTNSKIKKFNKHHVNLTLKKIEPSLECRQFFTVFHDARLALVRHRSGQKRPRITLNTKIGSKLTPCISFL